MVNVNSLGIPGFQLAEDVVKERLIAAISGLEKAGKTHFALSAPGDVALFNIDDGLEGVVHKFSAAKKVYVFPIEYKTAPGEDKATIYTNCVTSFETAYYKVLKSPSIRSIIIDTASELWELYRLEEFGKLSQVLPVHYGPVNARYRDLIRAAYASDKNLILLHKLKPEYVNDKKTSNFTRSGFSDTGFLVQINAEVARDPASGMFSIYVNDCRHNPTLAGQEFPGELCNFPMIASMVFNNDVENWY